MMLSGKAVEVSFRTGFNKGSALAAVNFLFGLELLQELHATPGKLTAKVLIREGANPQEAAAGLTLELAAFSSNGVVTTAIVEAA